jgi:hypothetical protein
VNDGIRHQFADHKDGRVWKLVGRTGISRCRSCRTCRPFCHVLLIQEPTDELTCLCHAVCVAPQTPLRAHHDLLAFRVPIPRPDHETRSCGRRTYEPCSAPSPRDPPRVARNPPEHVLCRTQLGPLRPGPDLSSLLGLGDLARRLLSARARRPRPPSPLCSGLGPIPAGFSPIPRLCPFGSPPNSHATSRGLFTITRRGFQSAQQGKKQTATRMPKAVPPWPPLDCPSR